MIKYISNYTDVELIERWDEFTSPARFAGSDDTLDLIFIAKRKGNKLKLTRRARTASDPFASIFRGKIVKTEKGSEIVGVFTKSIFDYTIVSLILAFLFYIRTLIIDRGEPLGTINGLLVIAIIAGVFFLYNRRSEKRKYSEFIFRITGNEQPIFLSKKEEG